MRFAKRVTYLLPVMAIVLSACGGAQASQVADKDSDFFVALPRVVVDIDDAGKPSIAGISTDTIQSLSGVDMSQYAVPKDWVDYFKSTGTQHVELAFNGNGMFIYGNGKQLPHVAFNEESVANLADVAGTVGKDFLLPEYQGYIPLVQRFLPLARRLGLNLVIRFPYQGTEVPLRDPNAPMAANAAKPSDAAAQVRIVVNYDDQGVPSVAGISVKDLEALTGYDIYGLKLDPGFVQMLTSKGIQHISMRSEPGGLALQVNDKALPSLMCDADCLKNSSDLISTLNTYEGMGQVNQLVSKFGPELKSINAELALRFPVPPGSSTVPLPFGSSVN